MVNVPEYNPNITQVNIPSMRDFQDTQREYTYETISNISKKATAFAEEAYTLEQKYKAEIQGAKDVEELQKEGKKVKLETLPTPSTQEQEIYNKSAINAFNSQFVVDTSIEISNLENQNRKNPYKFLEEAKAYIAGTTKDIPEHLKTSIVSPLESRIASTYDSLLKQKVKRDNDNNDNLTRFNIGNLARIVSNIENPVEQNEIMGELYTTVRNSVAVGSITPEYGEKIMLDTRKGIATQRLGIALQNSSSPEDFNKQVKIALSNKTGIVMYDTLSPVERYDAVEEALKKTTYQNTISAQLAEDAMKKSLGEAMLKSQWKNLATGNLTEEQIEEYAWNPIQKKALKDSISNNRSQSVSYINDYINSQLENGILTSDKLDGLYENGYINGKDYANSLSAIYSPISQNAKSPVFKSMKDNIDRLYPDVYNSKGQLEEINLTKDIFNKQFNSVLSTREMSDDEILTAGNNIIKDVEKTTKNKMVPMHTPKTFKEKTGIDISIIDKIVRDATRGGRPDYQKIKKELKSIFGESTDVNVIFSLWRAVRVKE